MPVPWNREQLIVDAEISTEIFRRERMKVSDAWKKHYFKSLEKFERLFQKLDDLKREDLDDETLVDVFHDDLRDALRYLAGPPISDDDLKVIADVKSLAQTVLRNDPAIARDAFDLIWSSIDTYRFPWIETKGSPDQHQKNTALTASAVLLAAQRVATERRVHGGNNQERNLKKYLKRIGFEEIPAVDFSTIMAGPQHMQFCGECKLGDRKADVFVRLHDTRLMPIECKVSNSTLNSLKRLNNDAAAKAEFWIRAFGDRQVVPAALLAGVFAIKNLENAQKSQLALFWSHDLDKLGDFIKSTKSIG